MASSGLIPVFGSFPSKKSLTIYLIFGILDEPPTRTISSIYFFLSPASLRATSIGSMTFLNNSAFNSSNLALVNTSEMWRPSTKSSISILTYYVDDNFLFPISISLFNF